MAIERDWVMRLAKQLADVLARAMKLRTEKKDQEAETVVAGAVEELLGIELKTLELVDSPSGAELLGTHERIATFARLLEESAVADARAGRSARARSRRVHAREMYEEAKKRGAKEDADAGILRLSAVPSLVN